MKVHWIVRDLSVNDKIKKSRDNNCMKDESWNLGWNIKWIESVNERYGTNDNLLNIDSENFWKDGKCVGRHGKLIWGIDLFRKQNSSWTETLWKEGFYVKPKK